MENKVTVNNIVYFARLHWIIFLWPILLFSLGLVGSIQFNQFKPASTIIEIVSLIWLGITWITFHCSSLTITTKQVIFRTGLLVRQTLDISLIKIESIDIRQSVLGAILGYGALVITGTGGTRHMINLLNKPLTCRRYIEQLMHQ